MLFYDINLECFLIVYQYTHFIKACLINCVPATVRDNNDEIPYVDNHFNIDIFTGVCS